MAQLVKNPPARRETWVGSLGCEDSLEKEAVTHSSILAWRIPWAIPWGRKESDTTERLPLILLRLNSKNLFAEHDLYQVSIHLFYNYYLLSICPTSFVEGPGDQNGKQI